MPMDQSLSDEDGTLTRAEIVKGREECYCGASIVRCLDRDVCSHLRMYGHHRDKAE